MHSTREIAAGEKGGGETHRPQWWNEKTIWPGEARHGDDARKKDDRRRPQVVVMWSYCPGQTAEREDRAFAVCGDVRAIPE